MSKKEVPPVEIDKPVTDPVYSIDGGDLKDLFLCGFALASNMLVAAPRFVWIMVLSRHNHANKLVVELQVFTVVVELDRDLSLRSR